MMKKIFVSIFVIFIFFGIFYCVYKKSLSIQKVEYDEKNNEFSCVYKNQNRKFILCLPDDFEKKDENDRKNTPLVILLHGYGANANEFKNETKFHKLANKKNYAVLYVTGTANPNFLMSSFGWHYNYDSLSENDMNFLIELAKYHQKKYGLSKKTFVVGFSNGAILAIKLAVAHSDFFCAVVSVAGMMTDSVWNHKKEKNKIGFMQINGTKDELVPMELNNSTKYNPNPPMEKVIEYFARANELLLEAKTEYLSERTFMKSFDSKVCWCLIADEHHTWPSERWSKINVNQIILDFFDKF